MIIINSLKTIYRYRDLLWMWTLREIKIRYKQSILGVAWAILQPLSLTVIFTVVLSYFARVPTEDIPYPIFAYSALLPWTLLSTSIGFAAPSLVNNMNLVTKIYFPKEILPLAALGAALVDFLISGVLFIGMMLFYRIPISKAIIWIPLLLIIQVALILGVSLLTSAINVFYRDIRFVVPLALQLWFYASPVIYPVSLVPERFRFIYMMNPMAGLINSYRQVILQGKPPIGSNLLLAGIISFCLCIVGYIHFKRVEPDFADII